MFQEIREKRGLCYKISAGNTSSHDTGIFDISCAIAPDKVNELITTTIQELKKTVEKITDEECKRAIVKLKSNILMSEESNSSRAQRNASNILSKGRIIETKELIDEIEAVNTKKLQNVMEDILYKSKPTIAILGKLDNDIFDYDKIINEINKG